MAEIGRHIEGEMVDLKFAVGRVLARGGCLVASLTERDRAEGDRSSQ